MSRNFNTRFRLTAADFESFNNAYFKLTKWRRVVGVMYYVLVALLAAAAVYYYWVGIIGLTVYFFGLVLALLVLRYPLQPFIRRRQFASQHLGDHEIAFSADEEGFTSSTPLTTGTSKWSFVRHVDDMSDIIVLWLNNRLGHIIPKRAFASPQEAQSFAQFAKEKTAGQKL